MTEVVTDFLVRFLPFAAVITVAAIVWTVRRRLGRPTKAHLVSCDYIVFEAEPINLGCIQADLVDSGWRLAGSTPTDTDAQLYRFEKGGSGSRCLSEIFDFDKSMPRTCKRSTGNDSLIKINAHGSSGGSNA